MRSFWCSRELGNSIWGIINEEGSLIFQVVVLFFLMGILVTMSMDLSIDERNVNSCYRRVDTAFFNADSGSVCGARLISIAIDNGGPLSAGDSRAPGVYLMGNPESFYSGIMGFSDGPDESSLTFTEGIDAMVSVRRTQVSTLPGCNAGFGSLLEGQSPGRAALFYEINSRGRVSGKSTGAGVSVIYRKVPGGL